MVFIGQKIKEVEGKLGHPDLIVSKFKQHYYYIYHKLGLQIDFGSADAEVQALFFYLAAVHGYSQSPAETSEGLGPGSSKAKVDAALGRPDKSGGTKMAGDESEWFWYKQGIQFDFNRKHTVDVMTIFNPDRNFADQLS